MMAGSPRTLQQWRILLEETVRKAWVEARIAALLEAGQEDPEAAAQLLTSRATLSTRYKAAIMGIAGLAGISLEADVVQAEGETFAAMAAEDAHGVVIKMGQLLCFEAQRKKIETGVRAVPLPRWRSVHFYGRLFARLIRLRFPVYTQRLHLLLMTAPVLFFAGGIIATVLLTRAELSGTWRAVALAAAALLLAIVAFGPAAIEFCNEEPALSADLAVLKEYAAAVVQPQQPPQPQQLPQPQPQQQPQQPGPAFAQLLCFNQLVHGTPARRDRIEGEATMVLRQMEDSLEDLNMFMRRYF